MDVDLGLETWMMDEGISKVCNGAGGHSHLSRQFKNGS